MTEFNLDYETASEVDLEVVGLANYLDHPSTRILMAAYAEGDHKPKLWEPHRQPKPPKELAEALEDPFVVFNAWNVAFEIGITRRRLNIHKPVREWRDTIVRARYLSLPGSLDKAGEILGLGEGEAKLKEGKRLIAKFCSPSVKAQASGLFGSTAAGFRNWDTDPEDWHKFGEYCKQDVVAEAAIGKKLVKFPVPEHEWEAWILDAEVNETGWPVDMSLVRGAREIVARDMERLTNRLVIITGLENPNSVTQLLPWLREHGYTFPSLNKTFVARALAGECELSPEAKESLIIRGQTAKSSVSKYNIISNTVSPDGRLRHQYTYYGASRTGRWAAHGVNVGNLPRPDKAVEKRLDFAVELVQQMDYQRIIDEFKNPLDVVSSTIRPSFKAPKGMKFVVCDLAAIENIMLSYICRCDAIRNVFVEGKDPYLDFATKLYNQPYEELLAEYRAGDKTKRTIAKPATLGCGYAMGAGNEFIDEETGIKTWTGLMNYSRSMGIELSQAEAENSVRVFRESYPEVTRSWKDFERAAIRAIRKPGQVLGVGVPHSDKDRAFFIEKGRNPDLPAIISFRCTSNKVLEMILPSGRSLHYIDPRIDEVETTWKGETRKKLEISYFGKEQNKQIWGRVRATGGKFLENSDQAISRDILVNGMKNIRNMGVEIVGHTYDEIVCLVPEGSSFTEHTMEKCMTQIPAWCEDRSLPLRADGYSDYVYRKN